MHTSPTDRSRRLAMFSSAALWAVALLLTGMLGGFWFLVAAESAKCAMPPAAILALTLATTGFLWQQSRVHASRRWQSALDGYADREIATSNQRRQDRRSAMSAGTTFPGRVEDRRKS